MSYCCQTCSLSLTDIGKHLSQTRHKKVLYEELNEIVECEECGDENIHLIRLLRYGLSDMALLCLTCSEKRSTAALAEYTLSNGSLFSKLLLYYTFRDIECSICKSDRNLFVGKEESQTVIFCNQCLENHKRAGQKYYSEEHEKFLFVLLGLKEFVPKPGASKNTKRKIGRKGGRPARDKVQRPDAEQRRAHYENKKATEAAFKSSKTIKAVGTGVNTSSISKKPNTKSVKSGDSNNVFSKSSTLSSRKNLKPSPPLRDSKDLKDKKESKTGKRAKPPIETLQKTSKPCSKSPGNDMKPARNLYLKKTESTEKSTPSSNVSTVTSNPEMIIKSSVKSKKSGEVSSSKVVGDHRLKFTKREKKANMNEQNASSPISEFPVLAKNRQNGKKLKEENGCNPPVKLPSGIHKYEPSKTPKITYDSMNDYFNEMCYNLFLEEKASFSMSNNIMITSKEFELEWYADQEKKHKQFKFNILMTPEFYDRFVTKKMQALKKLPFSTNQAVFLILNDEIVWYGNIVLCDLGGPKVKKAFKKGRGKPAPSSKSILEVMVELYPWNSMPLPISVDVNFLKIMPASIPVSRVFLAMSRISNPKFIDMILGKKPIKQIVFKNFLKFTKDSFNESQKVAIQSVLNNSITVLQGPPGTGKTSTIYEIILQLLENLNTFPILVVAASNIAIDNIAEKLLPKHGKSILRIVSNEKEPEYSREHPLASICLHHKVFDGLPLNFQETIMEMRRPGSSISQSQYKKLLSAQIDFTNTVIGLARVIFTTTVVAGGNQLKPILKMPVVIMDEATQSSEPTTLIPLSMPGVEKFVFVGDQKQLSSFSQVPNLSLSLFERIILSGSYKTPHMLDTQYRMHPAISEFPRKKFYDGLLKDGITAEDRIRKGIPRNPVVFWDTCGKFPEGTVRARFREDNGLTYANKGEINYIDKVLTSLIYEKGVKRNDIGVITPYRGQRDLISSSLVKNDLINPGKAEVHVEIDRDDFFNESKPITIHMVSDIMIASIDAFQGREKDFLVMSCVRSNEQNKIGFLNDARRMNVALTRAKYGLILVGDVNCLYQSDPLWKEYIDALKSNNCVITGNDFEYN